jgi:iron complex outermembrane receptor protein
MKTRNYLTLAILAALVSPSVSAHLTLEPVLVTATKTKTTDVSATFASEVYNADDIKASGSTSFYDFLNQNTSINVMPSYGNPYAQQLDMRGYGISDGYENIAISVNGRRMNNIDGVPQLLSSISLNDIERIEITKGSGSVVYGDGAMAGSIQIYTKKDIVNSSVSFRLGNYGRQTASISTGLSEESFQLLVSGEHNQADGFSDKDNVGYKDESSNNNSRITLNAQPTSDLNVYLSKEHSNVDTRYPGKLSLDAFNQDPSQNNGKINTYQTFKTDTISFGIDADVTENISVSLNHSQEDKESAYVTSNSLSLYDYQSNEFIINFKQDQFGLVSGIQRFNGERESQSSWSNSVTSKINTAYFAQGEYYINDLTLSLGGRKETVDYRYNSGSTTLSDDHNLSSYDLGLNQKINDQISIFSNFNSAYQAPNIDRFFSNGMFNSFIEPAESKTLNVGLNYVTDTDKSKITLFRSNLHDEIYYFSTGNFLTSYNTNIDKSHKYGLELQNRHQLTNKLFSIVNYSFTRAIIDNESDGAGAFNGKDLPGVSKHAINVALNYSPTVRSTVVLSHNYRSSAYAANDFANTFSQKQKPYQSTSLSYTYIIKQIELSLAVDNIFEESNGLWVRDDAIYPVNFTRNWNVGAKLNF